MIKIEQTSDKQLLEEINRQLENNYIMYGKRYCPCAIIKDDDTVCMCKEFRELKEGTCNCGKYIKTVI